MSEKTSKQKAESSRIAIVGERELVIGYRILGIEDTFIVSGEDANKTMQDLFSSDDYALIITSESVRHALPASFRAKVEASIQPLVLFLPGLEGSMQEESLSSLARRVLGISIKMS